MENEEKTAVQPDAPLQDEAEEKDTPLFENQWTASYEDYLQCFKELALYPRQPRDSWRGILGYVVLMVVSLVFLPRISNWMGPVLAGLCALMILLVLFVRLFVPRDQAKKTVRRWEEIYGTLPVLRMSFFCDEFSFHNSANDGGGSVRYEVIDCCCETQDLLLLVTREKQFFPLSKAGFSGTDAEKFKRFMREKAPNAKFRWQ